MTTLLPALATCLWLAGLWYAAPLLSSKRDESPASRLRDAIVLGTGIPFVLSLLAIFYPIASALALAGFAVARTIRHPPTFDLKAATTARWQDRVGKWLPIGAAVTGAWPALVRPIMQGDSLLYHLPNAAIFATTHSAYATDTQEWFYPCASEMFASGIFQIGGPLEVGLAGLVASLLLALRLMAFCRRAGVEPLRAGIFVAAVVSVPLVALQGPSLENDVWLSAWLLEALYAVRFEPEALASALSMTALLKPYGWIFAGFAALYGRREWRPASIGLVAPAIWALRDVFLWSRADLDPQKQTFPILGTLIAAHGSQGLVVFATAVWQQGPGMVLLAVALALTIARSSDKALRAVAAGLLVFFLIEPFAYANANPQLATGASLRYLFPALFAGVVGVLPSVARLPAAGYSVFAALALWQLHVVTKIFAADGNTRDAVPAGIALVLVAAIPFSIARRSLVPALAVALLVRAGTIAASHPLDYYDVQITAGGAPPSRFYEWLAQTKPRALVGDMDRIGSLNVASPGSVVADGLGYDACREAGRLGALVVALVADPNAVSERAARRASALRCGAPVFDDGSALVTEAKPSIRRHRQRLKAF